MLVDLLKEALGKMTQQMPQPTPQPTQMPFSFPFAGFNMEQLEQFQQFFRNPSQGVAKPTTPNTNTNAASSTVGNEEVEKVD